MNEINQLKNLVESLSNIGVDNQGTVELPKDTVDRILEALEAGIHAIENQDSDQQFAVTSMHSALKLIDPHHTYNESASVIEAGTDFNQAARIEKVQGLEFNQAEKLIFNWVKAGVINVRNFSELIKANRDVF